MDFSTGLSAILHVLVFAVFVTCFFFGYNIHSIRNKQKRIAAMLGEKLFDYIRPFTVSVPRNSAQSAFVQGELDMFYANADEMDHVDTKRTRCIYATVIILAVLVIMLVVITLVGWYMNEQFAWGSILVYIFTVFLFFILFEASLFITVISKYNPLPPFEEMTLAMSAMIQKLEAPVESLYDDPSQLESDSVFFSTRVVGKVLVPLLQRDCA